MVDTRGEALEAIVEALVEAREERLAMYGKEAFSAAAMSSTFAGPSAVSDTFELVEAFGVPPKIMPDIFELIEVFSSAPFS